MAVLHGGGVCAHLQVRFQPVSRTAGPDDWLANFFPEHNTVALKRGKWADEALVVTRRWPANYEGVQCVCRLQVRRGGAGLTLESKDGGGHTLSECLELSPQVHDWCKSVVSDRVPLAGAAAHAGARNGARARVPPPAARGRGLAGLSGGRVPRALVPPAQRPAVRAHHRGLSAQQATELIDSW